MGSEDGKACTICRQYFAVYHMHHTVPRSRGGENSLQIPLCSTCHNLLHANGVALVARIRSGKKTPIKRFWNTPEEEANAQPYLKILVEALLLPIAEGYSAQHPVHLSLDTETYEMLKLLQSDLGASSLEKTIRHSIEHLLSERGLGNAARNRQAKQRSQLWFLRSPD